MKVLSLALAVALAAGCPDPNRALPDAAVDLSPCTGAGDVGAPCSASACTGCKDGLACVLGASGGRCHAACQALPPPCTSGFCCDTQATINGGGTTSTCEPAKIPGIFCDTLDGGG